MARDMTKGNITGHLIAYAVPLVFGNLFQQLYNTADALIVGNLLGDRSLAAVTSTGTLVFLLVGFFAGIFMAMLDIVGLQLTNLTAYNEYITDVIISVIVYLSAFSLLIQMMLTGRKKKLVVEANKTTTADIPAEAETQPLDVPPEDIPDIPMEEAPQVPEQPEEGGEQA